MNGNLKIIINIDKSIFLEQFLNYAHQGFKEYATFLLGLFAMEKGMKFGEFNYYLKEGGFE